MKTKIRIFILCAAVFFSTSAFAQQLNYTSILQELQAAIPSLTQDIDATQVTIQEQQDILADIDAQIADAIANAGGSNSTLDNQRQQQLDVISALQTTLAQLQAALADTQYKIAFYTDERNRNDKAWVMQNNSNSSSSTSTTTNRINSIPDLNNPNSLNVIFQSTGDSAQDAQILHDWLLQYGLVDN